MIIISLIKELLLLGALLFYCYVVSAKKSILYVYLSCLTGFNVQFSWKNQPNESLYCIKYRIGSVLLAQGVSFQRCWSKKKPTLLLSPIIKMTTAFLSYDEGNEITVVCIYCGNATLLKRTLSVFYLVEKCKNSSIYTMRNNTTQYFIII